MVRVGVGFGGCLSERSPSFQGAVGAALGHLIMKSSLPIRHSRGEYCEALSRHIDSERAFIAYICRFLSIPIVILPLTTRITDGLRLQSPIRSPQQPGTSGTNQLQHSGRHRAGVFCLYGCRDHAQRPIRLCGGLGLLRHFDIRA